VNEIADSAQIAIAAAFHNQSLVTPREEVPAELVPDIDRLV